VAIGIKNPQTWVRLRRNDLRKLANQIGNHAMQQSGRAIGDFNGRPVKELTENIARKLDGQPLSSDINLAFHDLSFAVSLFQRIIQDKFFNSFIANRVLQQNGDEKSTASELVQFYISDVDSYIKEYRSSLPPPPTSAERLAEVVPDQKIGPTKFQVVEGILRVRHQAALTDGADAKNANAAREELICASEALEQYLEKSNVDNRLSSAISDMRHRLSIQQDIIQLGIAAISFQMVCEALEDELPDVWGAKLRAYTISIGMYVAQFPEWIRFSENAAMADFSLNDVKKLYLSGSQMVEGLRALGPAVDPEVPQTLEFLLQVIHDPQRAVKRTVFAAIRTIENLVSTVFRSFSTALSGVPEGAKTAIKYITITSLLALTAKAAIDISPAAGRVLQVNWMSKAGNLILESLKSVE
jgi:hypothetical protein